MTNSNHNRGRAPVYAALALALLSWAEIFCAAATVTRGPYLQQGTPTSIVVRWRTDVATASAVGYGLASGNFTTIVNDATVGTEHIVAITNLAPATKYFYELGTGAAWFTGDTNDYFITAPPAGPARPTRIWALGDSGTASTDAAAARDAYTVYNGSRPTDVWLMLGDNAYSSGTDAEYQTAVFDFYPTYLRNTVLWPTIGNHDGGSVTTAFLPNFTLPQNAEAGGVASGTKRYYSFDRANIHFICLDSATSDLSAGGAMCTWLNSDLGATTQDWIIAFWHHPPYSKGSHDSDSDATMTTMRNTVLPILESYGVDLVLCGHSHSYERSFLLDGHYGNSTTLTPSMKKDAGDGRESGSGAYHKPAGQVAHQGTVYTVAGSSGKSSGGLLNHPAMFISLNLVGSVVIDVNASRLDMIFLQTNATAGDQFTILKAVTMDTNPPGAVTNLLVTGATSNSATLSWTAPGDDGYVGTATSYDVRYGTNLSDVVNWTAATPATGEPAPLLAGTVQSMTITGLLASSTYYFALKTSDETNNVSPLSNVATTNTSPMVTPDTTPPAAVVDLRVTAATTNSATLAWTAPGDDGSVGTATSYDLRYSTSLVTLANWTSATPVSGEPLPLLAGTVQSMTITGLLAGSTYYFALKTTDETNNLSPLSNVASTNTPALLSPDVTPPGAVTNLLVTAATTNSATLAWTAPGDDGYVGTATAYDLRFSTNAINATNFASAASVIGEPVPLAAGTAQSMTITGLLAGRTYFFAVKSVDETNNVSPLSNVASTNTPALAVADTNAPAAVSNLLVTAVTTNSATLSWTAPGDDGNVGTATSYDVRYSTSFTTLTNWTSATQLAVEPVPLVAGTAQSMTITGLLAGRTYYFALKTSDEVTNVSRISNVATGTTPVIASGDVTPPAAVTNLLVTSVTSNSVTLAWTAPGDDGYVGTAARYDLRYSTSLIAETNWASATQLVGEPAPLVAGSAQSITVTTLAVGGTYFFAMKTSDEVTNVSPISNVASATTLLPLGTNASIAFLVPSNSVWKYLDNGSNQSNAWAALAFNDSAWASGPAQIGYGGGSVTVVSYGANTNSRYITTYFRRHFIVDDSSVFSSLRVGLQRDDGAAVFLNGTEVFRDNLPANAINYLTLASSNVTGADEYTYFPSPLLSPALLVNGDNVVAVEMHQSAANSSDMHLNLELRAYMGTPVTHINLVAAGQFVLRWGCFPGKHYQVQSAPGLMPAIWTNLGTNVAATGYSCSVTNPASAGQQRFYRVVLLD